MSDESRRRFEKWAKQNYFVIDRNQNCQYTPLTEAAWRGYQAATAAQQEAASPVEVLGLTIAQIAQMKGWFQNQSGKDVGDFWTDAFNAGVNAQKNYQKALQQEAVKGLVDALIEATAYMSPRYAGVADIGYNQAVEIVNKALAAYQAQAGEE